MEVSYTDHSHIIGRGGNTISRVMEDTRCHVHFPDSNRTNQTEKSNLVTVAGELAGSSCHHEHRRGCGSTRPDYRTDATTARRVCDCCTVSAHDCGHRVRASVLALAAGDWHDDRTRCIEGVRVDPATRRGACGAPKAPLHRRPPNSRTRPIPLRTVK